MSASAEQPPGAPAATTPEPGTPGGSLVDALRFGVLMLGSEGQVVVWSPRIGEVLGWSERATIGRPLSDFLVGDDASVIFSDMLEELRTTGYWRGQLPMRHARGGVVELDCRANMLSDPDGGQFIVGSVLETSVISSIEQDLGALDGLFSSSPLGIALFDNQRRIVRVNEALANLYDSDAPDLMGRTVLEVLPAQMSHKIYELQNQVLETGRSVIDLVTFSPDGAGALSLSLGRLTDRGGRILGISCIVIDITERREAVEKTEQARQRLALLDDVGLALSDRLDVRRVTESLARVVVPRFADYAAVFLRESVLDNGELPALRPDGVSVMQLAGQAARSQDPLVSDLVQEETGLVVKSDSVLGRVLATGHPWLIPTQEELKTVTAPGDPSVRAAVKLGVHSVMALPLHARGTVLGLLVLGRSGQRDSYTNDDLALAREIAGRAGASIDNARLYVREREAALMLQRGLLPPHVPEPPGLEVAYRYVPGSTVAEVGGDWFDVIPLPDGRTALVIGDVMGHGLRAAATMGRLRTAVRTLAGLNLPPAELLRRVNDLSDDLAQGPDDPITATCVYAVYDPASRVCTVAKAGHVPPMLLSRSGRTGRWRARQIELDHGQPLGVSSAEYQERQVSVTDGAILVLYTDGLVERRGEDLTDGLDRLCEVLGDVRGGAPELNELCDRVVRQLAPPDSGDEGSGADDVALLTARLGGPPDTASAAWTFAARDQAVRRARGVVRQALRLWQLDSLNDTSVLLVSELVTNAVRYAGGGPVGVRLRKTARTLVVEVSDHVPEPPVARTAAAMDETGRGLELVSRSAERWGMRQSPAGKTVWFELALPQP